LDDVKVSDPVDHAFADEGFVSDHPKRVQIAAGVNGADIFELFGGQVLDGNGFANVLPQR